MNCQTCCGVAVIAVLQLAAACGGAEQADSQVLRAEYDKLYQQFVEDVRAADAPAQRLALIREAGERINGLFAEHLRTPAIAALLPRLVEARLVDLEPTFVEVIDEHPDPGTRALALFCFAKYSGNNGNPRVCAAALAFLKQTYGELPYQDTTFAKAADEALYFFQNLAVGRPAPATVGHDVDGALFRLTDYRGKVVMLRFWGNWCPACRQMYGYERELVRKYKNQPFALIGVNSDSREGCRRAQRESQLTWRSMWDGGTTHGPLAMVYRVTHWPTIVVIDARGIIRYRSRGLAEPQLTAVLERLVREAAETHDS